MVQKGNPGNFISKLLMIANQDNILGNHLSGIGISHKNARCTSATIQNEIIGKIGSSIILGNTVEEIQNTKLYSTLQLMKWLVIIKKQCLRFVDKYGNIREAVAGFLPLNPLEPGIH